jgi:hypothetical protein
MCRISIFLAAHLLLRLYLRWTQKVDNLSLAKMNNSRSSSDDADDFSNLISPYQTKPIEDEDEDEIESNINRTNSHGGRYSLPWTRQTSKEAIHHAQTRTVFGLYS